jgi:tetratricopeptide (TPR) repeat protein
MKKIKSVEKARIKAQRVINELILYNDKYIKYALLSNNIFEVLKDEISLAREMFEDNLDSQILKKDIFTEILMESFPNNTSEFKAMSMDFLEDKALKQNEGHNWNGLIDTYYSIFDILEHKNVKDNSKITENLMKLSSVYENQLNNYKRSFAVMEQVFELNPNNIEIIKKLEYLSKKVGNVKDVIYFYNHKIDELTNNEDKCRLLYRSGKLSFEVLKDYKQTIYLMEKILKINPKHEKSKKIISEIIKIQQDSASAGSDKKKKPAKPPIVGYNIIRGVVIFLIVMLFIYFGVIKC